MSDIELTVENEKSSSKARGKRLKSLRMMMDLSRKFMEKKYQISASTMQSWEDGKAGGLTLKGAKRIVHALREEGVNCNIDWLLYGVGSAPQVADRTLIDFVHMPILHKTDNVFNQQTAIILQELALFKQYNPHAIDLLIADDAMEPFYQQGDYVAGIKRFDKHIQSLVGLDCIVETVDGQIMLRYIRQGSIDNHYTLTCKNLSASVANITMYNKELISAAPVIWHRRFDRHPA